MSSKGIPVVSEVHDKEMKRLAKEFQSQAKSLDRLALGLTLFATTAVTVLLHSSAALSKTPRPI